MVASPCPINIWGARWLLARRGAVLGDEMGLGKTLTALLAARALMRAMPLQLMVVAPVGLHGHWRREAEALDVSVAHLVELGASSRRSASFRNAAAGG